VTIEELRAAAAAAGEASAARELEQLSRELIARCEEAGNEAELAYAYGYLGGARRLCNDAAGAKAAYRRSQELFEKLGDALGRARGLVALGLVAADIDLDFETAHRLYEEALPIVRASDDRRLLAVLLGNLTEVLRLESDFDAAARTARESIEIFRTIADPSRVAWQLIDLAHCLFMQRRRKTAAETMREAYANLKRGDEDVRRLAEYFDMWFIMAAETGAWPTAAQLLGFVYALRDAHNLVQSPSLLPWNSRPRERISRHLGDDEFEALLREGAARTAERANALAEAMTEGWRDV
jgi:tetratricopeptide (TPR) repeat protein